MTRTGRHMLIGMIAFGILAISGCSSFYIPDRTMTLQEIMAMADAGVASNVMIAQIDATHTSFVLTSDDLIMMKKANVPDDVVEHMIDTGVSPERYGWEDIYDPIVGYPYSYYYPFYRNYYYPYHDIYYRGGPYRIDHPYVVRQEPGRVGRFYEYSPAPGYPGGQSRRPTGKSDSGAGKSDTGNSSRRHPDNGKDND